MVYDIVIVGGGPSGLTAGIYGCRAKLNVLIIEKLVVGGAVNYTYEVKNYPGFEEISGPELVDRMLKQAKANGVNFVYDEVIDYELNGDVKKIICNGGTFLARSVILCNGASNRKLGLSNEEKLTGSGVSYCAVCDGAFFRGQDVAVVGGGNTAMEDAVYLSNMAKTVYVICRKDKFKADKSLVCSVKSKSNIKILYNKDVVKLNGDNKLEGCVISDSVTNKQTELKISGLFVAIGKVSDTSKFKGVLNLTNNGYIITDEDMRTNIKGVYACGDVREKSLRQIITACSDGAIASTNANQYLSDSKE